MDTSQPHAFNLMLVDDEPAMLGSLKRVFRNAPYTLHTACSGLDALDVLEANRIDAAIVDLRMPKMDGLQLLDAMQASYPKVKVVMLTGYGGVKEAVEAIQSGAMDFLQKPVEPEAIETRINQIYQIWQLQLENRRLREQVQFQFGFDQLIGHSAAMLKLKKMILQVSSSDAPILIQGATGTGKELVARAIHHHSSRKDRAFVPVDCGSINETVMGSELFGHVKGAFTGANESTRGLVRSADKGTLFLDEVGELSLSMQVKLLRVIQEKEVRPVGASQSYPVDVRFLAATNRNLDDEVAQGRFRQDLYYRLNVVVLGVPSLMDRKDDVPLLSRYFLHQFSSPASPVTRISDAAMSCLHSYDWPGNVRELENAIRRAIALGQGQEILSCDLPETIHGEHHPDDLSVEGIGADSMAAYELAALRNALSKCNGHRKRAARMLAIGEATLYRKLNKYSLS